MEARFAEVRAGRSDIADALSAARSARNRATRDAAAQATEDRARVRHHKRRRAAEDRDRKQTSRIRIYVPERERPRMGGRTPRKLIHRLGGQVMRKIIGSAGGSTDFATRSIHFAVVARGFGSRTGRRWRAGEGERAALYTVREEGVEGGEAGWWSTIAVDRNELAAFHRASEALEKHDRKNANVYVTEIIALDAALSARQRRNVVRRYCRYFDKRNLPYTVAMHAPDPDGDQRNFHCHIVYSLRPAERLGPHDWAFAASKVTDVNTPDGIRERRGLICDALNTTLIAAGKPRRYTPLSNRARGLPPGALKQGQKATWAARRAEAEVVRSGNLEQLQGAVSIIRAGLRAVASARRLGDEVAAGLVEAGMRISTQSVERGNQLERLCTSVSDRLRMIGTGLPLRMKTSLDIAQINVDSQLSMAAERLATSPRFAERIATTGGVVAARDRRRAALEHARMRAARPAADLTPVWLATVMRLADRYRAVTEVRSRLDVAVTTARNGLEGRLRARPAALGPCMTERLNLAGERLVKRRRLEAMRGAVERHLKTAAKTSALIERTKARLDASSNRIRHGIDMLRDRLDTVARHVADHRAIATERRQVGSGSKTEDSKTPIAVTPASPAAIGHAAAIARLREMARQRGSTEADRKKARPTPRAPAAEDADRGDVPPVQDTKSRFSRVIGQAQAAASEQPPVTSPPDGKPNGPADWDDPAPWWHGRPRPGNER